MMIKPITLNGSYVRLEPLSLMHLDALCQIGLEADLWQWTPTKVKTTFDMRAYIEQALAGQQQDKELPFVIVVAETGDIVGSTRFGNIDRKHHRLEIGWTWIATQWQRTVVNTETKLLMLRYAFETLKCHRVELKTDALNVRSRAAITRLGAIQEGVFRKHMQVDDGRIRDTVYFSIIDDQWPDIQMRLLQKLKRF